MSYTFKNLADIELLTEVPETANKIIEIEGSIKRVPNKEVSGGDSIVKTAWLKQTNSYSGEDTSLTGTYSVVPSQYMTFECPNMTLGEALGYLQNGEPLTCLVTAYHSPGSSGLYQINRYGTIIWDTYNSDYITIQYIDPFYGGPTQIYWTPEGIFTSNDEAPPSEE